MTRDRGRGFQGGIPPWLLPLALALAIGAALRFEVTRLAPPFLIADSAEYFAAALGLLSDGEFRLAPKRTPLYPLFLAGTTSLVGPSLDRIAAIQHGLGLLTIGLGYLLGSLAFGRLVGLLAACGVALNGSLLTMEHTLVSEALFTPLLLAGCAAMLGAIRSDRAWLWLAAGLLMGLGALCRPLGVLVPVVALGLLPAVRLPRNRLFRGATLLSLGCAAFLLPWIARQAAVQDVPGVNSGLGHALYSRVRRYDSTFTLRDDGRQVPESERAVRARLFELAPQHPYPREVREQLQAEFGLTYLEADRLLRDFALTVIAQEPARYVRGTLVMTARSARGSDPGFEYHWYGTQRDRVWDAWPAELNWALHTERSADMPEAYNRVQTLVSLYHDDLWSGGPTLLLAALGTIWALRMHRSRGTGLLPMLIATQLLLYVALDGPLWRYRASLQPLITLLGAAGLFLAARQVVLLWRLRGQKVQPVTDGLPAGSRPERETARRALSSEPGTRAGGCDQWRSASREGQ